MGTSTQDCKTGNLSLHSSTNVVLSPRYPGNIFDNSHYFMVTKMLKQNVFKTILILIIISLNYYNTFLLHCQIVDLETCQCRH